MRRDFVSLTAAWLLVGSALQYAGAQSPKETVQVDLRQFMSASEFKAAGLEKLSAEELRSLNRWVSSFTVRMLQAGQGGGEGCGDVIDSRIEGTFQGWRGDTIFKLTNGQIWQQSSYAVVDRPNGATRDRVNGAT